MYDIFMIHIRNRVLKKVYDAVKKIRENKLPI